MQKSSYRHHCHNSHEDNDCVLLCDAYGFHADKHHDSGDHIVQNLRRHERHSEPVHKNLCSAVDITAHTNHDGQPIDDKYTPAEYLLHCAVEQLSFETFYQLDATVVIGQLGNDQVQDHVHTICNQYHPHDIQHTVLRGKIRNGNDARADAVADDHADGFEGREMGFGLDFFCHMASFLISIMKLYLHTSSLTPRM